MPEHTNRTTKQDLAEYLVEHTRNEQGEETLTVAQAGALVHKMLMGVVYLADNSDYLQISGFGRFQNRARAARRHTNPIQGAEKIVPARTVLWFTASKTLALIEEEAPR